MRVGLNLIYLVPGETGGMEVYARELIPRLATIEGLELTAFVNRETADTGEGPWFDIPNHTVAVRARNRMQWVRGEQQHLPGMAARAGCQLVHSLASTAPLRGRFMRVTTIHDLHYKLVSEAHFGALGLGMRVLVPASARRAHRIIAISRSTASDLQTYLRTPARKIDVVPQGVGQGAAGPTTSEPDLRAKLGLGSRPILLSVSAKRPHKNLMRLLDAHAALEQLTRPVLVIPGYPTPHEAELIEHARALDTLQHVRLPSWVPPADLEGLYAAARGFVFPSLNEGFGLPVLEAMRRAVPVACSNRSALPEVAGDAALLFDPEDTLSIRAALERLLHDSGLRSQLRDAGLARAALFSWDATATATAAVYRRVLGSAPARL